jgi:hypothetical protein
MPKYEHVLPKQQGAGFAQDPPQEISNASGGLLDKELSISNAAVIGMGVMYGKKIVTSGFNALIDQTGNSRYERYVEVGTKLLGYTLLGVASGPAAIFTVPAAVITDVAVNAIDNSVTTHVVSLDNARTVQERGVRRKLGMGGYYD